MFEREPLPCRSQGSGQKQQRGSSEPDTHHTCVYIHTHIYTHMHTHTRTCAQYTNIHIYTLIYTRYIHTYIHVHRQIHIPTHVYTYIHIYICTFTYTHTQTYTETHTHIYTHPHTHTHLHSHRHTHPHSQTWRSKTDLGPQSYWPCPQHSLTLGRQGSHFLVWGLRRIKSPTSLSILKPQAVTCAHFHMGHKEKEPDSNKPPPTHRQDVRLSSKTESQVPSGDLPEGGHPRRRTLPSGRFTYRRYENGARHHSVLFPWVIISFADDF